MASVRDFSDKVKREQLFHNEWAKAISPDKLLVRETFESPTAIENQHALKMMGELAGKRVLDLGCGAGEASVYFALLGAEVHACDIAEEFLKVARQLSEKHGVSVHFYQAEAGRLPFADGFFDRVYGNGVLHHVDLAPSAQEISRVLKKGGKAVFIEPLPYNPVINIYRKVARGVRTEDERPLTYKQLGSLRSFFSALEHQEFWFFSLLLFLHFYFIRRWDPSKVRYWKKIIEEGENYKKLFRRLQALDHFFLGCLPFLRPLCWNTVLTGTK